MAKKPKPKPKPQGQQIVLSTPPPTPVPSSTGQVYIGVDTGSDLETQGYQVRRTGPWHIPTVGTVAKKPLYKVGYLNSKDFARELNDLNPDTIYFYQQRLNAVGLLDKFTPGQMDTATRNAFKSLIGQANQTATTWQKALQDSEAAGGYSPDGAGGGSGSQRQPFVATLDDPATLRVVFQNVARETYGRNLPDDEINSMVDAWRNVEYQRQKSYYDMQDTGGTVDNPNTSQADAEAFAQAQIKANHPNEVGAEAFGQKFQQLLDAFTKPTV